MSELPKGEFNMPPGVSSRDIPGNDDRVECPACGECVEPVKGDTENSEVCPECGYVLVE